MPDGAVGVISPADGLTVRIDESDAADAAAILALQRRGLGSAVLMAIERRFPPPACFELFTGHRSDGNLRLHHWLGYVERGRQAVPDRLQLVDLRKHVA